MAGRTVLGGGDKTREEDCSLSSRLGQALWIVTTTCVGWSLGRVRRATFTSVVSVLCKE
jgi:hypothetical protein